MSAKIETLFSNHWNVRVSDPGEEGNINHFFETVYITLDASIENGKATYQFVRKVENDVKVQRQFTDLDELVSRHFFRKSRRVRIYYFSCNGSRISFITWCGKCF